MIGIIIVSVVFIIGATIVITIDKLLKAELRQEALGVDAELKKAEIERELEIANRALDNDVLRAKINDISTSLPYGKAKTLPQDQREAYTQGYKDGAEAVKDEAKRIVMFTGRRS